MTLKKELVIPKIYNIDTSTNYEKNFKWPNAIGAI